MPQDGSFRVPKDGVCGSPSEASSRGIELLLKDPIRTSSRGVELLLKHLIRTSRPQGSSPSPWGRIFSVSGIICWDDYKGLPMLELWTARTRSGSEPQMQH